MIVTKAAREHRQCTIDDFALEPSAAQSNSVDCHVNSADFEG